MSKIYKAQTEGKKESIEERKAYENKGDAKKNE
jgi:hypothetical protein